MNVSFVYSNLKQRERYGHRVERSHAHLRATWCVTQEILSVRSVLVKASSLPGETFAHPTLTLPRNHRACSRIRLESPSRLAPGACLPAIL